MKTVIIGQNNDVGKAFTTLLSEQPGFSVSYVGYDKPVLSAAVAHLEIADLIILDLSSAKASTRFLISEIREVFPKAKIIALHIYKEISLVKPILQAGASAYLPVDTSRVELLDSIDKILQGESYISKEVQ
jgi:DNA-binding NarL/FixJ family response regulator